MKLSIKMGIKNTGIKDIRRYAEYTKMMNQIMGLRNNCEKMADLAAEFDKNYAKLCVIQNLVHSYDTQVLEEYGEGSYMYEHIISLSGEYDFENYHIINNVIRDKMETMYEHSKGITDDIINRIQDYYTCDSKKPIVELNTIKDTANYVNTLIKELDQYFDYIRSELSHVLLDFGKYKEMMKDLDTVVRKKRVEILMIDYSLYQPLF